MMLSRRKDTNGNKPGPPGNAKGNTLITPPQKKILTQTQILKKPEDPKTKTLLPMLEKESKVQAQLSKAQKKATKSNPRK